MGVSTQFAKEFSSVEEMKNYFTSEEMEARKGETPLAPYITPTPAQPKEEDKYFVEPTSPASNLIIEFLEAGENVADLQDRKKNVTHGAQYEVLERDKSRQLTMTSPKDKITLEVSDIEKFTGSNKTAKKIFALALIKINEQAFFNGELKREYASFPLHDLIDLGMYSSEPSARKGFYAGMDALTDIKVNGDFQRNTKNRFTVVGLHPFRFGVIRKKECYIQLETAFNWKALIQYYTFLPKYYFALPNRASDLIEYICYLARQNTREIEQRGYFNISFRAIQIRLQLPSEKATKNPGRDIQDPIEEAITQIETEHCNCYGNMDLQLLPCYDEAASISEYLDNGYLKVTLAGDFARRFIALSQNQAKQIEKAEKRQERITEKAVAINTAKALEAGKKKKKTK